MGHSRSTYEELLGKRAQIAEQIADLQHGLEHFDWVIAQMFPPKPPKPPVAESRPDPVSRAELMERVMTGQGALKTKDVLRLLAKHGFVSDEGRATYSRVCATLSQSSRFERVDIGLYKVADARPSKDVNGLPPDLEPTENEAEADATTVEGPP